MIVFRGTIYVVYRYRVLAGICQSRLYEGQVGLIERLVNDDG